MMNPEASSDPDTWATRDWAVAMTRHASVTGTPGEASFGPWLAETLERAFASPRCDVWTFPVAPGDERLCVAMLVRGRGPDTVLLTGHYDTVSVDDYGELAGVATEPDLLLGALLARLRRSAETPAEARALADLSCGAFLPGRGLLDMKAGLAAGVSVAQRFLRQGGDGNVLFVAVPDEERSSDGARKAATELRHVESQHRLDIIAAINLDAMADDGDGAAGRVIALGTIGKVLPTAFVVGLPTHAGFPLAGLNAAALAGAIAARAEWATELTDRADGPATPPSVLLLRDGKAGYDVTTPETAFLAVNTQIVRLTPDQVLDAFDGLCREAIAATVDQLRHRVCGRSAKPKVGEPAPDVPVIRFAALAERVARQGPEMLGGALAAAGLGGASMPERCRAITERLWRASRQTGPAVVTGFASVPYLPTSLSGSPKARRLATAAAQAAMSVGAHHEVDIRCEPVFAGISDMSFLGEADEGWLDTVAPNTPGWAEQVRWPEHGGIAGIPIVNVGPWGRDYHTPLERIEIRYGFDVVPDLVEDVVRRLLDGCTDRATD